MREEQQKYICGNGLCVLEHGRICMNDVLFEGSPGVFVWVLFGPGKTQKFLFGSCLARVKPRSFCLGAVWPG